MERCKQTTQKGTLPPGKSILHRWIVLVKSLSEKYLLLTPFIGRSTMSKNRTILIVLLILLAFLAKAEADQSRFDKDTLNAILRTTTKKEKDFIDNMLTMISQGQLPVGLFDSTVEWARKKPNKHRFQYFNQALAVRAQAIGIVIPVITEP
jgi:hypothetical protein